MRGKDTNEAGTEYEIWIDIVKLTACFFVVLGHFLQSMVKSEILPENHSYLWFNQSIYYFHVPLFFICSGYLYQKGKTETSGRARYRFLLRKLIMLGVPYLIFSSVTWGIKSLLVSDVNEPVENLATVLLIHPLPPYWYLYILFFIFAITPAAGSVIQMGIWFIVSVMLYIAGNCSAFFDITLPYIVSEICKNELWFSLGMMMNVLNIPGWLQKADRKKLAFSGITTGMLFILLSVIAYERKLDFYFWKLFPGLAGCLSVILSANFINTNTNNKLIRCAAPYFMPVFLFHTIMAAGVRIVLLKLGISLPFVHVTAGLAASFAGPVMIYYMMKRNSILNAMIYPAGLYNRLAGRRNRKDYRNKNDS